MSQLNTLTADGRRAIPEAYILQKLEPSSSNGKTARRCCKVSNHRGSPIPLLAATVRHFHAYGMYHMM